MTTLQQTVTVRRQLGLHLRPASEISEIASNFDAIVTIAKGEQSAYAHSVVELMTLEVYEGDQLDVSAFGYEAAEAMEAVIRVLTSLSEQFIPRTACIV